jgi:hypothetical protein
MGKADRAIHGDIRRHHRRCGRCWLADHEVRPPQLAASSFQNLILESDAFGIIFLKPFFCGVSGGEDFEVIFVADLLAGFHVDQDCFHEALKAHQATRRSRGLVVQRFVLRDCLTAACQISANLCIAKRFWDLMPPRRDQKLFPHLGEAGTAVFAVQEVEYGGHDLTSCLICTISSKLSFFSGPKM